MMLDWFFTMRRPADERIAPSVGVRRTAAILAVALFPIAQRLISADIEPFPAIGPVAYGLVALLVAGVWLASVALVFESRRRLANAPDDQLDERERTVRDEAHLIGYRILSGLVTLLAVAALLVVPAVTGTRVLSLDVVLDVLLLLVVGAVVLPSAVVAWRDTATGGLGDVDEPASAGGNNGSRWVR